MDETEEGSMRLATPPSPSLSRQRRPFVPSMSSAWVVSGVSTSKVLANAIEPAPIETRTQRLVFRSFAGIRFVALYAIMIMGIWPLIFQVTHTPQSVFGDGHGDRYEQTSYFAMENDHYQILRPRALACDELHAILFPGTIPQPTRDLIRAIGAGTFKSVRDHVVNRTTGPTASAPLDITTDILGLGGLQSACFGGVDDEGSVQIEALLSRAAAPTFGLDPTCLDGDGGGTHLRLRLQPTEFYTPDSLGELNPERVGGAMLLVTPVDVQLRPVITPCHAATREHRRAATAQAAEYQRLVSVYSHQLLVPASCDGFRLFDPERDAFGCAFAAIGASGAVPDLLVQGGPEQTYSFPAPWRMIQCTTSGECSSLLFTQLWLSEWTVEAERGNAAPPTLVLRHNFVNHKVIEVTVDGTFSLRLLVSVQVLSLAVTARMTSVRGWYRIRLARTSPWALGYSATTPCTIAKIVRSSYNYILAVQVFLGVLVWRRQFSIDMLVGADPIEALLRAQGCATLVILLSINVVFARAGDLRKQEIEPAVAHVVGITLAASIFGITQVGLGVTRARQLLVKGMSTVPAESVMQYSGCRGSTVCAREAALGAYIGLIVGVVLTSIVSGILGQLFLQSVAHGCRDKVAPRRPQPTKRPRGINTFTRYLDDRSRRLELYDCSTEIYVRCPSTRVILSTRAHIEACGFVPGTTMLFRYRDLPLFLVARIVPVEALNLFNLTATIFELSQSNERLGGMAVYHVSDHIVHAHWSSLKLARLDWSRSYFGGLPSRHSSNSSNRSSNHRKD